MILDRRLGAAAAFVPNGARLADIGSDHAYLPISLCLDGKIDCALASDINEGPVMAAVTNIKKNGLLGKIEAIRADGLSGAREFAPDCITVLGMGGELIVSILDAAPWIKDEKITLILQPMTHPEILSRYLLSNGFEITDEVIVQDGTRDDRIYRVIAARYCGRAREIVEVEALVGKINIERLDSVTRAYIERLIRIFDVRATGKRSVLHDASAEEELIEELKYILGRKNEGNRII